MFIVRINHKNGLYLEFLFLDVGKANAFAIDCAKAQNDKLRCHLFDEAGRETWLDGAEMQAVQFTALEDEIRMNTRMKVLADMVASQWLKDMGLAEPQGAPNGRVAPVEAESAPRVPAIGGAQFAT